MNNNGYVIYINGEFDHWYPGFERALSYYNFLRDMMADDDTVDLIDSSTGEIVASTVD